MYVSSWPGLTLRDLFSSRPSGHLPYPLCAPRHNSFYVARSGIYHLFRSLKLTPQDVVLAPDYYSGNEVGAMSAAGARIVHYPVLRNFEPDLEALYRLADQHHPRVIYVIHYLGWPQPMAEIEALRRRHASILVEDCALSMLSEGSGAALGTFGDYSIFCLYKSLPVPNGGLLVQNNPALPPLGDVAMEACPILGAVGRSSELLLESLRARYTAIGALLGSIKRSAGRVLRAARLRHVPVGDIGWDLGNVNVSMSSISRKVMAALDFAWIRERRRENFLRLLDRLRGRVVMPREDLPAGVCPLFFPILVKDKHGAAEALRNRNIGAVEFWNDRQDNEQIGEHARYLRAHVLELPIHQGVDSEQVEYIADSVLRLNLEAAA